MNPLEERIKKLENDIRTINDDFYFNNFSSSQDFNKYSRFNTRLKVPTYTTDPTVGEVGDLIAVSGKLKICTVASLTAPTFTIVGTQT